MTKNEPNKNNQKQRLNLMSLAEDLIQYVRHKTGQNLRYGTITFTYHNGACVHVDSSVTRRVPLKRIKAAPLVLPMKIVGSK